MRININERLTDERLEGMRISNVCGGKRYPYCRKQGENLTTDVKSLFPTPASFGK